MSNNKQILQEIARVAGLINKSRSAMRGKISRNRSYVRKESAHGSAPSTAPSAAPSAAPRPSESTQADTYVRRGRSLVRASLAFDQPSTARRKRKRPPPVVWRPSWSLPAYRQNFYTPWKWNTRSATSWVNPRARGQSTRAPARGLFG